MSSSDLLVEMRLVRFAEGLHHSTNQYHLCGYCWVFLSCNHGFSLMIHLCIMTCSLRDVQHGRHGYWYRHSSTSTKCLSVLHSKVTRIFYLDGTNYDQEPKFVNIIYNTNKEVLSHFISFTFRHNLLYRKM